MIKKFIMPEECNIDVKIFHKGEEVGSDFFEKNPNLIALYPSKEAVLNEHNSLKRNTKRGMKSLLKVSENGIKPFPNITQF